MLYDAYEIQRSMLAGASTMAEAGSSWLRNPSNPMSYSSMGPVAASALHVFAHAAAPRGKPAFGFTDVVVDGRTARVTEEIVVRKAFGQLKRFRRTYVEEDGSVGSDVAGGPRLMIVAPMSGHYATLLRGTVERMLPEHDVYVTDWRDAKLVPLADGRFDLDDYVDYLVEFLAAIGPAVDGPSSSKGRRAHMLAVCQPSVPCLAAVALMSADADPARPATLTMMGGPVDTREAPTSVNTLATDKPHSWFSDNVIATVPVTYPGAGRTVYPGFLQLAGFMSMNLQSHMTSHYEMYQHLVAGDGEKADATKDFYEEYRSVCDMTSEFYLQTIDVVFQTHALPRGEMTHRGRRVDVGAITDVAILAIEGERDDISGLGQTKAALTIATALPDDLKKYHMAPEVGHYGIFNGRRWRDRIAPVVEEWIAAHDGAAAAARG